MLNKNHMVTGVLIGLIFPGLALATASMLRNNIYIINKPALPYFIAIAANLVLIRILFRKEWGKTALGIMLGTFVFMVIVLFVKVHPLR